MKTPANFWSQFDRSPVVDPARPYPEQNISAKEWVCRCGERCNVATALGRVFCFACGWRRGAETTAELRARLRADAVPGSMVTEHGVTAYQLRTGQ